MGSFQTMVTQGVSEAVSWSVSDSSKGKDVVAIVNIVDIKYK